MSDHHESTLTSLKKHLLHAWHEIGGLVSRHPAAKADLRAQMRLCLESPGGEVTARAHTAELGRAYLALDVAGREQFLKILASEFDVDHKAVGALAKNYAAQIDAEMRMKLEMDLRQALTTPRSTILRQFTALPDGFKFLINMRADVLPLMGGDVKLKGLEFDLKNILSAWFDIGLLDMAEITWKSPAALLEKLIEYEAVHRVASWDDLKNRLDADRRVFAFFHNKMPLEPLIFVHVALVHGMSDNIQALLDQNSPVLDAKKADTAIFYSITNAQKGLAGISFGNFLIKRVVAQLSSEMPNIKNFATLSPVPGFRAWLDGAKNLSADDQKLREKLDTPWHQDKAQAAAMKPALMRLCAHYLVEEKKAEKPLDPVAAFHLFNGSRLERLNWLGDTSPKGMKQSAGMMVNYHYKLSEIDENHEEFVTHGKIVASRQVKGYL